jgi:hypothetical protein
MNSKIDFLKDKAQNFKKYIIELKPDEEIILWLSTFHEQMLIPTIVGGLLPLKKDNKLDETADKVLEKLKGVNDTNKAEVKIKLRRYFDLFCEVVVS